MKEYGIGIIGTGFMGKTHAYAYAAMPYYYSNLPFRTRLIGACSATEKSAEYAQSQLGFEYGTTDFNKLIGDERIDIIHICTPNEYHYEQVVKALEAGKHVYCDKPLAFTYEECVKLAELARGKQVTAQMGMQSRFFPATLRAKEIAEEGRLGDIICFRGAYLHSGSVDKEKKMGWKQGEGVGTLQDMGPHILDMIVNLTGPVEKLCAQQQILYPERPAGDGSEKPVTADDHTTILMKMKNGATGVVEASKICTGVDDELRFEIHGTKGAIRFNLMQPNTLWFYDASVPEGRYGGDRGYTAIECTGRYGSPAGLPSPKNAIGWLRAHCHSIYTFVDHVYNGCPGDPSFEEGAYIQLLMEKAKESAGKMQWVEV